MSMPPLQRERIKNINELMAIHCAASVQQSQQRAEVHVNACVLASSPRSVPEWLNKDVS